MHVDGVNVPIIDFCKVVWRLPKAHLDAAVSVAQLPREARATRHNSMRYARARPAERARTHRMLAALRTRAFRTLLAARPMTSTLCLLTASETLDLLLLEHFHSRLPDRLHRCLVHGVRRSLCMRLHPEHTPAFATDGMEGICVVTMRGGLLRRCKME